LCGNGPSSQSKAVLAQRPGLDSQVQEVAGTAAKVKVQSAWLDGEVCLIDKDPGFHLFVRYRTDTADARAHPSHHMATGD